MGLVPERPISANPGLKFVPFLSYLEVTISRSKGPTIFCKLEFHVLREKNTLLKIWLNPGLNLTVFRETGPR